MTFHEINDPELLRQVNDLRKTDNYTNWFYLAREYFALMVVIGLTVAFYQNMEAWGLHWLWAVPVTIVSITLVGAGQHRLATLTHEAAHYMLFRNRLLNELASELFCMFPILGMTHPYRVQHLGHHQHSNDPERDPDWTQLGASGHRFQFPMTRSQFLWECVIKQILWPPKPIRYILVRAFQKVDQGGNSPYRLKRRRKRIFGKLGMLWALSLVATLGYFSYTGNETGVLAAGLGIGLAGMTLFLLVPANWYSEFFIQSDLSPRTQACLRGGFVAAMLTAVSWLTVRLQAPVWGYYLLLWILPLGTSFAFFMILRQLVQHGNADQGKFTNTRNFEVHPLISFAVFPIGNDYHLPHHLFPMVPHYNLKKAHALLMQAEPYRKQAVTVEGYFLHKTNPPRHPTVLDVMSTPVGDSHATDTCKACQAQKAQQEMQRNIHQHA